MVSAESNGKWTPDYKFCRITGSDGEATLFAYLDSGGSGEPVLFLHEFASFSYTWEKMLPFLPASYRYIRLDCIGFGYTVHDWTDELSTYNQAELIAQFILKLNLSCLTIIGHGMGGEIALLLMNSPLVRARVKQLMLISCGALEQNIPEFIDNIARSSLTRPVLRLIHSRFVARMMLTYGCAPGHTPDPEAVSEYGAMLKIPGRIQSIISAARSYNLPLSVPRGLQMPVTILCGEEDKVYPPAASLRLHEALKPSDIQMLSDCGHLPQEEFPQETALLIRNMLDGVISSQAEKRPAPKQETEAPPRRPLKSGFRSDHHHPETAPVFPPSRSQRGNARLAQGHGHLPEKRVFQIRDRLIPPELLQSLRSAGKESAGTRYPHREAEKIPDIQAGAAMDRRSQFLPVPQEKTAGDGYHGGRHGPFRQASFDYTSLR